MTEEQTRPSPDELLERIRIEEKQNKQGKLKIFLGYAPGVGKTYSMLDAARQLQKDTDVVVAYVETHGRVDTEALMKGLEVISRRQVEYKGMVLPEMDIDAILARHPKLALVDELAHENPVASRHTKRYEDVEELLQAGIDVYTALNVQHIESGRNVVAQITGIWVRETVPDSIIDSADEIEVVDLPPDELIKRLKEGKVYIPEQIAPATEKFFRKGNLIALRELALRTAARHIDEQSLAYMKAHGIHGPWSSGERLLLFIGPGSWGSRLVRTARRLAYDLGAEWSALYVDTPANARLPSAQQEQMTNSLRMAQRLGAKIVTVQGDSIVSSVVNYAKTNNITKIVIAKPRGTLWQKLTGGSIAYQIIRRSTTIDVQLVYTGGEPGEKDRNRGIKSPIKNWRGYLQGLGLIVLATLLGKLIPQFFVPANMIMVYLLCVGATAFFWGYGPSIFESIISVIIFDFAFVPPVLKFTVFDTKYLFTFVVLLLAGLVISYLMRRIRDQADMATRHEREMSALYALGRDLAVAHTLDSYISAILQRLKETFGRDAIIFLPDSANKGVLKPYRDKQDFTISENEMAAAIWSFQNRAIVGRGTDTLPNSTARYLPLVTARGTIGVLAMLVDDPVKSLSVEQERLLGAFGDLTAVAIEGVQLEEEAHNAKVQSQVLKDTEKLQTSLLNSISHDLRTPLVSIVGTISSLQEENIHIDDNARKNMIQVAREEAERLNRLITNLLDVSRLEAGAMKITKQPSEVQDIVGAALEQLGDRARSNKIKIDAPAELPFVSIDFSLVVQALVNVLDNAIKYSPTGSLIEIKGRQKDGEIHIEVADRGYGIPAEDIEHVFDKFYRIQKQDRVTGTGLGLSISKGIIEAHGGRVTAENRDGGGTIVRLSLPLIYGQAKN